jgi:alpha-L-fucosidase
MILLQTGESVKWKNENGHIKVTIPASVLKSRSALPALAFSFVTEG